MCDSGEGAPQFEGATPVEGASGSAHKRERDVCDSH